MRSRWITGGNSCTILYQKLWGRTGKARAGKGKTGPSVAVERKANPSFKAERDGERREVAKRVSQVPRKAAIVYKIPVP